MASGSLSSSLEKSSSSQTANFRNEAELQYSMMRKQFKREVTKIGRGSTFTSRANSLSKNSKN